MAASNADRRSVRVLPLYHFFAVCDWLVEPSVAAADALLAIARREVAATDGRQVVVCPTSDAFVTVHFEHLAAPPMADAPAPWEAQVDLEFECPSGKIYIDQPTVLAIDLEDALPAGPGTYGIRVAWRGRRIEPGQNTASTREDLSEQYLLQMWRTGPLSPAALKEFESDDD